MASLDGNVNAVLHDTSTNFGSLRVKGNGDGATLRVFYALGVKSVHRTPSASKLTCHHLARVVDDALVILVRPMREVHADCNAVVRQCLRWTIDLRTDVDTSSAELAELLHAVRLRT